MFIVLKKNCSERERQAVERRIEEMGCNAKPVVGVRNVGIAVTGNEEALKPELFEIMPGVLTAFRITKPYRRVSKDYKPENTVINVGDVKIGGRKPVIIAGPCSVEGKGQMMEIAGKVKEHGAHILRGGAYKPRSSPYSFQGLGESGLKLLAEAGEKYDMPVVTEALDSDSLGKVLRYSDIVQIGARNMKNYSLLKEAAKIDKPVLLKRGMGSTGEEILLSAEYLLDGGNQRVILCERGIKKTGTSKLVLDVNTISWLKDRTHLPVIADPSHAGGKRNLVSPLARAAIAAGVSGLMIEVHRKPMEALSDGYQALEPFEFKNLMTEINKIIETLGFYSDSREF